MKRLIVLLMLLSALCMWANPYYGAVIPVTWDEIEPPEIVGEITYEVFLSAHPHVEGQETSVGITPGIEYDIPIDEGFWDVGVRTINTIEGDPDSPYYSDINWSHVRIDDETIFAVEILYFWVDPPGVHKTAVVVWWQESGSSGGL